MIKKEAKLENGTTLYYVEFDNVDDMLNFITKTPYNSKFSSRASTIKSDKRNYLTGTKTFEEALELFRHGIFTNEVEELINLKKDLELNINNLVKGRKNVRSIYGYRSDVPRFIMGQNDSMYKIIRDKVNFINIIYNVTAHGRVSPKAVKIKGLLTYLLIAILESLNNRVNFDFLACSVTIPPNGDLSNGITNNLVIKLNIKRFSNKFDINSAYFPLCHPAYLRRIIFNVIEKLDFEHIDYWANQYGSNCQSIEDIKNMVGVKNSIVISRLENKFSNNIATGDVEEKITIEDIKDNFNIFIDSLNDQGLYELLNGNTLAFEENRIVLRKYKKN